MDTEAALREFGLSELEVKAYLALLRLGETTAPEVVKAIKSHDSNVYNALGRLENRGLVSHVGCGRVLKYRAVDPKRFLEIWEGKKDTIESVLPILQKAYSLKKPKSEVDILAGVDGIKAIFADMCKLKKPAYAVGSVFQLNDVLEYRSTQIYKKMEQNVKGKLILADTIEARKRARTHTTEFSFAEVRFYPESFKSPITFIQYGDRVAIIIWGFDLFAIRVTDKCVAKGFKSYFDMIWMISKE